MLALSLSLAAALSSAPATAGPEPRIEWFKGDVQAAFDLARKDKKPLFLYWGAVWCPPCNQIKKTIFTRREFIEKTRLFIPVYLDGDTESAQIWGEKLGASGYPTMMVYSPAGKEILRLPMGLQVEEFTGVLDQAIERMTPVAELLSAALAAGDPTTVPDSTWRVLAYYSWDQDTALELSTIEREEKFGALEARIPARLKTEKSRLFLEWLGAALDRAEQAKAEPAKKLAAGGEQAPPPFALESEERKRARGRVLEILADPVLTVANLMVLELAAKDLVSGLEPEKGAGRSELEAAWDKAMRAVAANEALSVDERLTSVLPALELHALNAGKDAPVPAELQDRVRKLVAWADQNAKDGYTRQNAMNTASQLLDQAGLAAEAKKLLLAEIEKAISPHYFMSSLAGLAREAGNKEEAVTWMRKAWETSKGRATRFQWGTAYLTGLMDLTPEAGERIRDESLRVFKELLASDDAFAGRNHARIKRLQKKYGEWNAKDAHAAEVTALRTALAPGCGSLSDKADGEGGDSLRGRCTAFFAGLGASN